MQILPLGKSRHLQQIIPDDGEPFIRARGAHNPVWSLKGGVLVPADVSSKAVGSSKIGQFTYNDRLPQTVGIRNDLKLDKLIGFRRDDDQEGKEQLEITPLSLKVDGLDGSFTPSKLEAASANIQDLGALKIGNSRRSTRIFIPYDGKFNDFRFQCLVHTKNLTPRLDERTGEYWFENSRGRLFRRFVKPGIYIADGSDYVFDVDKRIQAIGHDLQPYGGPDTWLYTKYNLVDLSKLEIPIGSLIDADVDAYPTADGLVILEDFTVSSYPADMCQAASGTNYANNTAQNSYHFFRCEKYYAGAYRISRSFFTFDCSGITNVTSGTIKFYCTAVSAIAHYARLYRGTQAGTLDNDSYNDFSTAQAGVPDGSVAWSASAWQTGTLSEAMRLLISDNEVKHCLRDQYDADEAQPSSAHYAGGLYFSYEGTDYDPIMDLTGDYTPPGWPHKAAGVASSQGKIGGVDFADVGKVAGVE